LEVSICQLFYLLFLVFLWSPCAYFDTFFLHILHVA
jgi:hypothetical protein